MNLITYINRSTFILLYITPRMTEIVCMGHPPPHIIGLGHKTEQEIHLLSVVLVVICWVVVRTSQTYFVLKSFRHKHRIWE